MLQDNRGQGLIEFVMLAALVLFLYGYVRPMFLQVGDTYTRQGDKIADLP